LDDEVAPFANRSFTAVDPTASRAWVLDLMQARTIAQVPVLDDAGQVIGLHVLREVIAGDPLPNVAVIMAGGRGTRLRPLTEQVPKPMLRVAGRPILERIVLHLVGSGIRRIHLAINYRGEQIEEHFGDGSAMGCEIGYLREDPEEPLGTAGALSLLADSDRGEGPLLVMNGDLVTDFDVRGLIDFHRHGGAVATVGARPYAHEVPYGLVEERAGVLVSLREKPTLGWLVNAGVYCIEPVLLDRLRGGESLLMTELLADCLQRGETVSVHQLAGDWADVGRPDELDSARGV
jgi:NDP-sugar pyrophosphorylase family protein